MKIVKVDGENKSYVFENGDVVLFPDIREYVKRKHNIDLPDKPKKKRRAMKKLKALKDAKGK